ncbi:transcription factor SKN7 [Vairimorpha necatrix]|uniref:Transcription factor SKN7 n=1 Tax=Vairimorpha necatrix TaxID=6039 RepID=A0AAX4JB58_9MICR
MQPKETKEFVKKLYDILEDVNNKDFIVWNMTGHSFIIVNPQGFADVILQSFFRHKNLSSFIRQLNKYDFHKIKSSKFLISQYGKQVLEFEHMYFQRGKRNQLYKIKRKSSSHEAASKDFELLPGIESYKLFQGHIIENIKDLSEKFSLLVDNINEIKNKLFKEEKVFYMSVIVFDEDTSMSIHIYNLLKNKKINIMIIENKNNLFSVLKSIKFDFIVLGGNSILLKEVMRFIRRFDFMTPVIYLGYDNLDFDVYSIGVTDFIKKPFTLAEFYHVVAKYMSHKNEPHK